MEKVLRSFIQEKFDIDTRVEIELLSRRRDISNEAKHEELIKLMHSKDIGEIVQLGPGTNRYAFKLDGFVVKVATDHDGKIDNLKEFKMAKRLYPYVTKTYEVSENGTLLIAEYIQPFASYQEMYMHRDRIREILTELSAVYLIGDVGITSNNYANWGERAGSKEPVCLDFAYVYEVSSDLFRCRYCDAHAMLRPDQNFTELYCSNPSCKKRYSFSDIRARIGNDIHAHEIGDLSDEGYRLFSSNVLTQLDEQRSNYLIKKRLEEESQKKKVEVVEEFHDDFIMDSPLPSSSFKEVKDMDRLSKIMANAETNANLMSSNTLVIHATATIPGTTPVQAAAPQPVIPVEPVVPFPEENEPQKKIQMATAYGIVGADVLQGGDEEEKKPERPSVRATTVVFSESMDDAEKEEPVGSTEPMVSFGGPIEEPFEVKNNPPKVVAEVRVPATPIEPITSPVVIAPPENTTPAPVVNIEEQPQKVEIEVKPEGYQFTDPFKRRMSAAVSKITNRIKEDLYHMEVRDIVSSSIQDKKMYAENFYRNVQNAAFRSLVTFCGFKTEEVEKDGKTQKVFIPPEDLHGPYEPTLIFINRVWDDPKITAIWRDPEFMSKYREIYPDAQGIQPEWIDAFVARMDEKMPMDINGAKQVGEIVKKYWCADPIPEKDEQDLHMADHATEKKPEVQPAEFWTDQKIIEYAKKLIELKAMPTQDQPVTLNILQKVAAATISLKAIEIYNRDIPIINPERIGFGTSGVELGDAKFKFNIFMDIVHGIIDVTLEGTVGEVPFNNFQVRHDEYDTYDEFLEIIAGFDPATFAHECTENAKTIYGAILDPSTVEDDDDDTPDLPEYLRVEIYYDDNFDIIKVCSGEAFGHVAIPFYTNLDKVNVEGGVPSLIDDRNGIWDWMAHMVPDLMFRTKDPERYLAMNDEDPEEDQLHVVILDNDNHGTYTMGVYYLNGIYVIDETDEEPRLCFNPELLQKINKVIREDIGYTRISHLQRSLSMENLINSEEYVLNHVLMHGGTIDDDDDEEGEDEMDPINKDGLTPAEAAALEVMTKGSDALSPDAPPEQKEAADAIQQANFNAFGVPVPEKTPETVDPADDGEEFVINEGPKGEVPSEPAAPPAPDPVPEPETPPATNNGNRPGHFKPVRRKYD